MTKFIAKEAKRLEQEAVKKALIEAKKKALVLTKQLIDIDKEALDSIAIAESPISGMDEMKYLVKGYKKLMKERQALYNPIKPDKSEEIKKSREARKLTTEAYELQMKVNGLLHLAKTLVKKSKLKPKKKK